MNKSDIFWQTYLNLEKEAIEVSKFIFITDEVIKNVNGVSVTETCNTQLDTFSPHIGDLLVRTCVQIEAISKELYFDNNGEKQRGDTSISFDEDCLRLIDRIWSTHSKSVLVVAPFFNLTKDEHRLLKPLKEAHRKNEYWEKAYQAVKHDRYSCLYRGNVRAFIQALAALYLLNIYYRNEKWTVRFGEISKRDFSMGSSLFAVNPPVSDGLWEGNNEKISDSPFVIRYQDADYKRIEDIQLKEREALNNYWIAQPELREPEFIDILTPLIEKQKQNPSERVMYIWELAKYRLHKRIPKTLPFAEKKRLLVNSEEWNGWIHLNNKHLTANELTPENIDAEINTVGICWGIELEKRFKKLEWIPIATNSGLCDIYIPKKNLSEETTQK